jgi:hypothetical protein
MVDGSVRTWRQTVSLKENSSMIPGDHHSQRTSRWSMEWMSTKDVDVLLFETTAKPIEKAIRKRATELAGFILGPWRYPTPGLDYGVPR